MKIQMLTVGSLGANCYLVSCPKTKEAVVIDPGDEGKRILKTINDAGLKVKYIINTHGHHDHIGANREVKEGTQAELLIHAEDADMLANPNINLSTYLGTNYIKPTADRQLQDGDIIEFGDVSLQVIHTPGHSSGGICLYSKADKVCFTGDTLFNGSVGRTDLPRGNYTILMKSLREKLINLPDKVTIYPGHGPKSTIGEEKLINPFLQ